MTGPDVTSFESQDFDLIIWSRLIDGLHFHVAGTQMLMPMSRKGIIYNQGDILNFKTILSYRSNNQ